MTFSTPGVSGDSTAGIDSNRSFTEGHPSVGHWERSQLSEKNRSMQNGTAPRRLTLLRHGRAVGPEPDHAIGGSAQRGQRRWTERVPDVTGTAAREPDSR